MLKVSPNCIHPYFLATKYLVVRALDGGLETRRPRLPAGRSTGLGKAVTDIRLRGPKHSNQYRLRILLFFKQLLSAEQDV
jgi:hypothetical protein